jgi:hypothetical protein
MALGGEIPVVAAAAHFVVPGAVNNEDGRG